MRPHSTTTRRKNLPFRLRQNLPFFFRKILIHNAQNVLPRQRIRIAVIHKVALLCDPVMPRKHLKLFPFQQRLQLALRPTIKLALLALAVGVFR